MELYRQAYKAGEAEIEIERSRFIAHVFPVSSREEAEERIAEIKSRYRDATHNVPAMVIGDRKQLQWASDDGEPQGTSGAPMLMKMVSEDITDTLIVVTRYFGGTKLGTGGLVRAYTRAADEGLRAAGVCAVMEMISLAFRVEYKYLSRIESMAEKTGYRITDKTFDDAVNITIVFEPEKEEMMTGMLEGLTAGKLKILAREKTKEKVPLSY